jgi:hypothetical protein
VLTLGAYAVGISADLWWAIGGMLLMNMALYFPPVGGPYYRFETLLVLIALATMVALYLITGSVVAVEYGALITLVVFLILRTGRLALRHTLEKREAR